MLRRILIVDDIEGNCLLLKAKREPLHYQVEYALTAKKALKIINSKNIDVILLDIMMPDTNGLELCKLIKSQKHSCHIPVIIISARDDIENRTQALEFGADEILSKPPNDVLLFSKIRSLIRLKMKMDALLENNSPEILYNIHKSDFMGHFSEVKIFMLEKDPVLARTTIRSLGAISENVKSDNVFNIDQIISYRPDIIILNSNFQDDMMEIVTHLKNDYKLKDAGIICIVGDKNSESNKNLILNLSLEGVGQYMFEPVEQSELLAKIKTLLRIKYYHMLLADTPVYNNLHVTKDAITSLGNMGYFENQMNYLVQKSAHDETSLHVVLIRIDNAKYDDIPQLDVLDHQLMAQLSKFIKNYCKSAELIARFGKWHISCAYAGHSLDELTKFFQGLQDKINGLVFNCMSAPRVVIKATCDVSFSVSERQTTEGAKGFMQRCKIAAVSAGQKPELEELVE